MKKLLLTSVALTALFGGSAFAADLRPAYKAAPLPPPVYSWTGIYWGVNVGYSWGEAKNDVTLLGVGTASSSRKMDGVIGGFQAGYNYQFGAWVWGFETDIQASGQKGGETFPGILPLTTVSTDHKLDWFGTSRSRLGFLAIAEHPALWHGRCCLRGSQGQRDGQRRRRRVCDLELSRT